MDNASQRRGLSLNPTTILLGSAFVAAAIYFSDVPVQSPAPASSSGKFTPSETAGAPLAASVSPSDDAGIPQGFAEGTVVENITAGDTPVIGNPNAKVLIVAWGDYQCPFTGRYAKQAQREIIDRYVKEGKVRYAYRDFAFIGQESIDAAAAARCANEQGKFWEYHEKLFDEQNGENKGAFSPENLKRFAGEIGLDTKRFNQCFDSGKFSDDAQADYRAGQILGLNGTPTIFVNGRVVNGAQPPEEFVKIIEEELAK